MLNNKLSFNQIICIILFLNFLYFINIIKERWEIKIRRNTKIRKIRKSIRKKIDKENRKKRNRKKEVIRAHQAQLPQIHSLVLQGKDQKEKTKR